MKVTAQKSFLVCTRLESHYFTLFHCWQHCKWNCLHWHGWSYMPKSRMIFHHDESHYTNVMLFVIFLIRIFSNDSRSRWNIFPPCSSDLTSMDFSKFLRWKGLEHQTFKTTNLRNSDINNFRCSRLRVEKAGLLLGHLQSYPQCPQNLEKNCLICSFICFKCILL